jgi:hypothetical protein
MAKTIFLTSTFQRGKPLFPQILRHFALSGKKVLLIEWISEIPTRRIFKLPEPGFTNYLSSKDLILEDLIVKYEGYEDFYVLPAGVIPPNPAELLMMSESGYTVSDFKGTV